MISTITDIRRILPHRPPFLFIDKVIDIIPGVSGTGIKLVSADEAFISGNNMTMPNVFHLEMMAQTSAVICAAATADDQNIGQGYLAGFAQQCTGQARPGDVLEIRVKIIKIWGAMMLAEGVVRVEKQEISTGRFTVSLIKSEQEPSA
jgi:3-hydroxyacyl-[acyl-carrier-protein] dehydratase